MNSSVPSDIVDRYLRSRAEQNNAPPVERTDSDLVQKYLKQRQQEPAPQPEPPKERSALLDAFLAVPKAVASIATGIPQGEVAASMTTGLGSSAWGGGKALADIATGTPLDDAISNMQETQRAVTYQPRSEGGKKLLEAVGTLFEPLESLKSTLGESTLEATGSPLAATAAHMAPDIALTLGGGAAYRGVKAAGQKAAEAAKTAFRSSLAPKFADPVLRYDASLVGYRMTPSGTVVPDPLGKALVDAGLDPRAVVQIRNASPETQTIMSRMLKKSGQAESNDVYAALNPLDSDIGLSVTNRLSHAADTIKHHSNALEELMRGAVGKTKVDIGPAASELISQLKKDLGFTLKISPEDGTLSLPRKFSGAMQTNAMSGTRSLINDIVTVYNSSLKGGETTARQAHQLKKTLDLLVDAKKASEAGLSNQAHRVAMGLRKNINESIRQTPGLSRYADINDTLSEALGALSPFDNYLPPGTTWENARVNNVVRNALNDLGTETGKGVALAQDLAALERYLNGQGLTFADDPLILMNFKRTLRDTFRVTEDDIIKHSSKASEALNANMLDAASSILVGNKFGAVHDLSRILKGTMKKSEIQKMLADKMKTRELLHKALGDQ